MPGVEAWAELADEVVAVGDGTVGSHLADALVALGLTPAQRTALGTLVAGREDPAGRLLRRVVAHATDGRTDVAAQAPATEATMDAALDRARDLSAGPAEALLARWRDVTGAQVAALPAAAAASLVADGVAAATTLPPEQRSALLAEVADTAESLTTLRWPVGPIATAAATADLSADELGSAARLLARAPVERLLSGLLDALRAGVDPARVVDLLARAAAVRAEDAPGPATTSAAPAGDGTVWRSGRPAHRDLAPPPPTSAPAPGPGDAAPGGVLRAAYPLIDIDAHRDVRPDVVVVDEPFDVTVGLSKFQDTTLTQTGALHFMAGASTEVELILVYDPSSLTAEGSTRLTLTVSDATPFPSATVPFVAQYRPDLPPERRIGVHYVVDGQVVGIAWRSLVAVPLPKDVATAPTPPGGPERLLDLQPLLGVDQPDLVLSICASDGAATGEFVWTAYAGGDASAVTVPDAPRSSSLESDLQSFVTDLRQAVAQSKGTFGDFLTMQGKATRMGRAIPDGIAQVLREVVQQPGRTLAPSVLLLTEEVTLPWELAVLDPPLDSAWGGLSPFLGAHAAIARWPLSERRPRPTPRSSVAVRRAAVLTADYTGVMGWGQLTEAQDEAAAVRTLFDHAVPVAPSLRDVVNLFSGNPPADVVHVALHGQFDARGDEGGLVLLATDAEGRLTTRPLFLTPDQVLTGSLDDGPFVFLNACQVGADKRVLADNGGFASTLLQIGATGVVAPLWNVNDTTAAAFAEDFYAATWPPAGDARTPVPAAEAVRALRARYTRPAAEAQTPGVDATLVAFQVFGHPRLRLDRG